jgi:putative effector of murein hydrolase LrgA (UPF0299 family)
MSLGFLTILLVCQLAGEVIVAATGLPVPGPVLGMALLFAGLAVHGKVPDGLQATAGGLLQHLSLLFVPAGVGVMVHLPLLADQAGPIAAALVGSTVLTIIVTALIVQWLARPAGEDPAP